ncbi:MAG: hypothetical protein LIV24_08860 [Eubacterium sp.]|nr:hypothetical protein [Eubacterium sp.]
MIIESGTGLWVIVTVDDNGGVLFNHRRQAMDRVVRKRIEELTQGHTLWMTEYTAGQFSPLPGTARICPYPLKEAKAGDYCFVEGDPLLPYKGKIDGMVRILWNRRYPANVFLDVKPEECGLVLQSTEDFRGYSHDRITMEIWGRS